MKTEFKTTIASIEDIESPAEGVTNPFLTKITFDFADDKPNGNKQGIALSEFDEVAASSINMPVKMNYLRGTAQGHPGATPIGHITKMYRKEVEGQSPVLVGEAMLYKEEYPQEVQFLKDAFAAGEAPGISWELAYGESLVENGIEWLKKIVTMAATFVKSPAYGKRTQLLAIAQTLMDDEESRAELKNIVDSWTSNNPDKGGNDVELEEQLKAAQAELQAALEKVTDLEGKLENANTQITSLTEENEAFKTAATLAERTAKIAEAGVKFDLEGEALQAKQALWLGMSQDVFDAYVADLAALAAKVPAKAEASQKKDSLPKFAVAGKETTLDDLKSVARRASRGDLANL